MTWQQTLSIIVAIVLSIAGAIGFFWLNLPTKNDFNNLEAKMDAKLSTMATKEDLKTTETHLKEILGIYQDSVKSLENDVKNHTSNRRLHALK